MNLRDLIFSQPTELSDSQLGFSSPEYFSISNFNSPLPVDRYTDLIHSDSDSEGFKDEIEGCDELVAENKLRFNNRNSNCNLCNFFSNY